MKKRQEKSLNNKKIKNDDVEIKTDENVEYIDSGIVAFFESVSDFMFRYLRGIGLHTKRRFRKTSQKMKTVYDKHLACHTNKLENLVIRFIKTICKGILFLGYRIYLFLHFFVDAKNVLKNAFLKRKDKNIAVRLYDTAVAFGKGMKNNRKVFASIVNYTLPVVSVIALTFVINYVWQLNFAVSVEYNGVHIGYIQNETVFEQAEAKLQQRMIYLNDEETIDNIPKFSVAVIPKNEIQTDTELTDALIKSSSKDIIQATGISIDGVFHGAVKDGDLIQTMLNEKLEKYRTGKEKEEVHFTKDVKLESGFFVAKNITSEKQLLELLDGEEETDVYYTIEKNDTPIIIASKNDMSLDELQALNPNILKSCVVGDTVLVNKSQAFLPVSVISTETYTARVPFQTKYTESSKYYKGNNVVTKKGVEGEQIVTAKVERVDGVEVGREILSKVVTKEPIEQQITKGTGIFYQDNTPYSGKVSNSGFSWPVSGSYISSGYGYRGRSFHTGVDMAFRGGGGGGTPIRAAAPGKVVFSGWNGSYGYMVKIDHGGGVQTWYAHASSLQAKTGQIVSQGQQIARVGSTGRSTGNHLHFEVRINGSTKNPRNYLP